MTLLYRQQTSTSLVLANHRRTEPEMDSETANDQESSTSASREFLFPTPAASITSMLSPFCTPTSVICKMYKSKEESKEEPASETAALGDSKEDTQKASEENLLSSGSVPSAD
ncbi:Eukaryotic translation initiation factor 4E transporter [Plecturocebus cupreus]